MAQKPTRLGLTRDQLASFLNDFEQIKQFEKLFASVDQITTVSLDDVTIAAENAAATANDALAQIADLSLQTELLSLAPPDLGGTVTSVGLSAGSTGLTVAGPNPITTSGTFTLGGILNVANGGTGTSTAFTQGSIIFAGASGVYSQDNANLNWDDTNNTLGVGRIASPNSRVVAKGATTGNGSFQFYSENSASVGCFGVRDDGGFFTGQAASSPYNVTTSSPANVFVGADGYLYRSTSTAGTGTVTSVDVSGGTTGLTTSGGPITTSGTITIAGTLNVANGGTGATSLTSGYLLKGNGTSAVSASVAYDNGSALLIGTTFNKNRLTVTAATNVNAPTLGSAGGIAYFTNTDVAYGLNIGNSAVDGRVWLQSQRTDGSAIAYNLTLNEAGGNVAIGKSTAATALDVNGTVTATSFTGAGTGLTGTASALSIGGNAATATTATSATTAGSVTNSVTFNNSGAGAASGTSFNGSVARTISYNTIGAQPAGTYVTSVGATAPVVSSGGTTPTISMAAATGSVNGYLTSTDWTTFNSKQAALVSGTNIKTVNGTSLLGSGDVGTIATGYGGTGLTSFTANGIMYASSTSALATSSALTFNGTNFATTGTASATKLIPTGGTAAGNGMYLPATNALAFSTNGSERARFTSAGEFLVNTTSPAAGNWFSEIKFTGADVWPLALNANNRGLIVRNSAATSGFYAYFEYNGGTANGSISWSGGTTAFNTTSDARIKDNIVDAPEAGDLIDGIKVRSWDFKVDGAHWRYGMVAQELLEVVPEAVSVPSDDTIMMGVDYSKLVPMLIKEVQSLRRRVAELEGN